MERRAPVSVMHMLGLVAALTVGCAAPPPATSPVPTSVSRPANPAGSPSPARSSQVPTVGPSPSTPGTPAVAVATAWGPVAIHKLPIPIGTDRHIVFELAGTPDGAWLIGVNQPNSYPDTNDPSYVVLDNVATGALRQVAELASPASQVLAAAADDRWVVWSEAPDQPYFYDWRLEAFDRKAGAVRELARATTSGGTAVPGPYPVPSVSHGLVGWGQGIGDGVGPGRMGNAVVRQADLTRGSTTTLATSAGMPTISWPWIAWGVSGAQTTGYLQVSNLQTKQVVRVDQLAPTFALDGSSAAFNDPQSLSVSIIDDLARETPARVIATGADVADHLEWVTLNARVVAWDQTTTTQVYDRVERRLVTLPVTSGRSGVTVCGPLIVWEDSARGSPPHRGWADTLVILDTSTLPVR